MRDEPSQTNDLTQPGLLLGGGGELVVSTPSGSEGGVQDGESIYGRGVPYDVAGGARRGGAPDAVHQHGVARTEGGRVHLHAGQPPVDQGGRAQEVQRRVAENVEAP